MSEQVWWFVTRASGIVAWFMLAATVWLGVVSATDLFASLRRPAWLAALHRWLAVLALGFLAVHLAALVADSYVEFDVIDLAVPFASDWRPAAVAAGVLAMWTLVVVQVTSLLKRHLSKRVWKAVHLAGYGAFWMASLHATFAGTDSANPIYWGTSTATLGAVIFATAYRVLAPSRRRRTRAAGGRS